MPNPNVGLHAASATTTCDPGYYLENGECHDCGSGYYCLGGTDPRRNCLDTVPSDAPIPNAIRTLHNGIWDDDMDHATAITDCSCNWFFSDETRIQYLNQVRCFAGPSGNNYTYYHWCRTGYYATDPLGWGDWYTACAPCDNGPAHAHYTSYSTPSVMYAVESNCPWECDDGYGRVGDTCRPLCDVGVTHLHAGGATAPLFPTQPSSPSLAVRTAGGVCYGNLTPGRGAGINVTVAGTTYHLE